MIPGRMLHRLASLVCSSNTLDRIIEPAIADFQKEFTVPTGVFARAWVLVVGYLATIKVIAICAVTASTVTDDDRRAIARTCVWSVCTVLAMTALLIVPPYYNFASEIRSAYAAAMLVPQAAPLAIPAGIAFALAFGFSVRPTLNVVKGILLGTVAASAVSFCVLVWAMPAGNQAFREFTFRALNKDHQRRVVLEKGYNEMTVSELRREIARFTAYGERGEARLTEFRLHLRIALAGASLALVCVLLASPVKNRGWRGLLAFAACSAYWALIFIGQAGTRRGYLPPPLGAWVPNIALIVTAILIASSRSSRLRGSLDPAR
jgi:hypothetical protein